MISISQRLTFQACIVFLCQDPDFLTQNQTTSFFEGSKFAFRNCACLRCIQCHLSWHDIGCTKEKWGLLKIIEVTLCHVHAPLSRIKTPARAWGGKQSTAAEKLLLAIVATVECIASILLKAAPFLPFSPHPLLGLAIIYLNLTVVLNGEITFNTFPIGVCSALGKINFFKI